MADFDLELLMAYADNELDDLGKAKVEAIIARDREAAIIVERFQKSRDVMKESFDEILDEPVPNHLVTTIRNHRSKAKIVSFRSFVTQKNSFSWMGMAIAASIALIIGIVTGTVMDNQSMEKYTGLPPAELLQETLEEQPAGNRITADNSEHSITPLLTFAIANGQFCREYERQSPAELMFGVACRTAEGKWMTLVEIDSSLLGPPPTAETGYSPAKGMQDPMAAALAALGARKSLTADEEQRLREKGWE